jgi:hypothetical protein
MPPKSERPEGQGPAGLIQGNGQPVVGGTVASVSGNTFALITAQGNITYTVDASSATVKRGNATSSVSNITTGDKVVVQGTVSNTSVTASSVIDEGVPAAPASGNESGGQGPRPGFLGALRGFFQHLFGFF